jgi:hypothetical protein
MTPMDHRTLAEGIETFEAEFMRGVLRNATVKREAIGKLVGRLDRCEILETERRLMLFYGCCQVMNYACPSL